MDVTKFFFVFTFWLFTLTSYISPAEAECQNFVPVHEIINSPNGVYAFKDGGGTQKIMATTFSINSCDPVPTFKTGSQFTGNYSFIGHRTDVKEDGCVIKRRRNGQSVYVSFQAVVIQTNGWKFAPTVNLDDIDAQTILPPGSDRGWKESMATFGMSDGKLVMPSVSLHEGTLLRAMDYVVKKKVMKQMGFGMIIGEARGGEYAASTPFNCPFGRNNEVAKKCRLSVSFETEIDTMVIMYALAQKSQNEAGSAAFFSELVMPCGCQCSVVDVGARVITAAASESVNECVQRESTSLRTQCDFLGSKWCSKKEKKKYVVTGEKRPNGHFPCKAVDDYEVTVRGDFEPEDGFGTSTP